MNTTPFSNLLFRSLLAISIIASCFFYNIISQNLAMFLAWMSVLYVYIPMEMRSSNFQQMAKAFSEQT